MRARIIGTGSCLPGKAVTNDELAGLAGAGDGWVRGRTGIRQRHFAEPFDSPTVSMATAAARAALSDAGVAPEELDLILVATVSPDCFTPSTACLVQRELGAAGAAAFDLSAACAGFPYALNTADAYCRAGMCRTALVIGAETISKLLDWHDRSTCVLFGDGAGAAVMRADERGMIACLQGADGSGADALSCRAGGSAAPGMTGQGGAGDPSYLSMDGRKVFEFAIKKVPACILGLLEQAGMGTGDVSYYLLHQANLRILSSIAKKLGLPMEKFPSNIDRCGNTSAASIPILLDEMNRAGKLREGDILLLCGYGAGFTWGASLLSW